MTPLPPRMADDPTTPERFSLKRWSRRKREAARARERNWRRPRPRRRPRASAVAAAGDKSAASWRPTSPRRRRCRRSTSLTFDSDYTAFMQPAVEEATKRAALKKLFSDPSFNVMDGLDIYVGDYTQPDPMPAGMLDKLSGVYAMLDAPPERGRRGSGQRRAGAPG